MTVKCRPGPLGASCLTCKRRHKKCDLRQPVCKRCEVGQFECEGYGHNRRGPARNARSEVLDIPGARRAFPLLRSGSEDTTTTSSPESFISPDPGTASVDSGLLDSNRACTIVSGRTNQIEDYLRLFATRSTSDAPTSPISILRKIINLQTELPYSPIDPLKIFLNRPGFVEYILEQSDRVMDHWYFKPVSYPKKRFQKGVVLQLQTSPVTRWIALISMSIIETFHAGDMSQDPLHNIWIGYIENFLGRELAHDLTPHTAQERRNNWLYVSVMKNMIIHSSRTYQMLRNMSSLFLQVAFSEPDLWTNGYSSTYVPLSNVLSSEAHALAYFALIDCTYAMASGLPQQIEYDTTIYPQPRCSPRTKASSSHQWVHSSPTEFQLVLADINACRDKSPVARDRRDIEQWLVTWQSRHAEYEFTESWMTVAWYAVQESWRLALLVYLYLAVYDVPSDDPRIQSCVKQVLQVVGTIKKRDNSDANVSLFVQYLTIGICARSETHRKLVRDKLSTHNEIRLWILRASDFVPVLDHLWHGAAAGGRPIKWSDYMRSREAALPITI
ncbi:unnamed protein product [Rhizoctonia solani]|uniref:Zn(2)-C6 fungal-type domain-containing protein n=1 Tax=Rhizoctonia solani TaxID=456999 RepID=A0A8H3E8U9_9AGAM|nr:unnamed protein product [Rhizoctonia solani]